MAATRKIKVTGYAASELDIRLEVAEVGDEDWGLLAQWTGTHIVAFYPEHAARLAGLASDLANGIDLSLQERPIAIKAPEERRACFAACRGLWTLGDKLRVLYAPAV